MDALNQYALWLLRVLLSQPKTETERLEKGQGINKFPHIVLSIVCVLINSYSNLDSFNIIVRQRKNIRFRE